MMVKPESPPISLFEIQGLIEKALQTAYPNVEKQARATGTPLVIESYNVDGVDISIRVTLMKGHCP